MTQESSIEDYLIKRVESCGGLTYKWVSPSNSGVPDRIVLINRQVAFVEVKAPGKKPRPLQRYVLKRIAKAGYYTAVIDTKADADLLIRDLLEDTA